MGFLNQASRSVVATVGPAMALEFGLSASGLGALAAVFFAAYALTQLPVGLAIDLYGARRVQMWLALVAALGFALCALAPDPGLLGVARFVTGIGIAGALIGLMKANIQWYPPQRLAAVTGAGVFIGAAGGLAATVPVQLLLPVIGWRGVFLGLAGLGCCVSLWIALSVPHVVPGAKPVPRRRLAVEIGESPGFSATRSSFATCRRWRCSPGWCSPTRGSGPGPGCAMSAGWRMGRGRRSCCSMPLA
ncbi:MFS transporter [Siccirubricoccus deserti]